MRSRLGDLRRRCRPIGAAVVVAALAVMSPGGEPALPGTGAARTTAHVALPRAPETPVLPAPPRAGLTVRVIAEGHPVGNAEVAIHDGRQPTTATVRTDAEGIAHVLGLDAGPHELWARTDALASPLVRIADASAATTVELVLAPAGRVRGQASLDRAPPAGATVELVPLDLDHAVRIAALDEHGAVAIDGVPYGHWRVESRVPGFVQIAEEILHVTEREAAFVLRLSPAGSVSGTVVDASGAPIANATIVLRDQANSPLARPLALDPSGVRWVHPLAGGRVLPGGEGRRFGATRPGSRPAECGRGHCGVDLGNQRGTIVHAIADGVIASVFTEDRGDAGRVVAIHHRGALKSFYMHLDEIRDGLDVGQPVRAGEPLGTVGLTGIKRSAPHLHFAITHERQGRTWYLDPEPLLRQAVVLPEPRPLDPVDGRIAAAPHALEGGPLAIERVTTDARGAFRIDGVAPGEYVAVAFAPELPPAASAAFSVHGAAQASGVVVTVQPGVMVHGRVVGRDGPIAGATVIAGAGFGETAHKIATTSTDRNGEFALRSLAGKVTLAVSAPRHGEAERTVVIDDGDRTHARHREDFTLLAADAQLRGQVLAPDGGAGDGVALRIVDGPVRRRGVTDAQGRFVVDGVPGGRYVVELSSTEYPSKRVVVHSDRFTELRLEAGGAASAVVRDRHAAAPLAGARVELRGPSGQRASRVTDARGAVELRGLALGAWTLTARATGYVAVTHTIAIRAGRAPEPVALELTRAATVAGVVRDRYGRRVAGARVSLGAASTQADADGNFRLSGITSGVLEAEHDGRRGELAIDLAPGEERVTLTVELAE